MKDLINNNNPFSVPSVKHTYNNYTVVKTFKTLSIA